MFSVGSHTSTGMRCTLGHKTALHQFLSRPSKVVGFDGLSLHPRRKAIQTFFQQYQGLKPEPRLNCREIRKSVTNVTPPVLAGNNGMRLTCKVLAQQKSDLFNRRRTARADIQAASIRCFCTQSKTNRARDIRHVHEIPALLSVLVQVQRLAQPYLIGEDGKNAGIWVLKRLPFPVHVLHPENHGRDAQRLGCDAQKVFLGQFGRSVNRCRGELCLLWRGSRLNRATTAGTLWLPLAGAKHIFRAHGRIDKSTLRAAIGAFAIHRARGRKNDLADAVPAIGQIVEQRAGTANIRLRVARNFVHGLRSASLRSQVDNLANFREDLLPVGRPADVAAIDFDTGVPYQSLRRNLGNRSVRLRAEVVEQQHLPVLLDEQLGNVPANESETTSDQYLSRIHGRIALAVSIFRAGVPATVVFGSTERSTTELAPSIALSPIRMPPRTLQPVPIMTLFPISGRSAGSNPMSSCFAPRFTPANMVTLLPIRVAPITDPDVWAKKNTGTNLAARCDFQTKQHKIRIGQ